MRSFESTNAGIIYPRSSQLTTFPNGLASQLKYKRRMRNKFRNLGRINYRGGVDFVPVVYLFRLLTPRNPLLPPFSPFGCPHSREEIDDLKINALLRSYIYQKGAEKRTTYSEGPTAAPTVCRRKMTNVGGVFRRRWVIRRDFNSTSLGSSPIPSSRLRIFHIFKEFQPPQNIDSNLSSCCRNEGENKLKTLAQQSCATKAGFIYLLKQQFSFSLKYKY